MADDPNQQGGEQGERDRRMRSLSTLFAWASAHGSHGEESGSSFTAMEKERQTFLSDAMKSMTVDVVEEIQRCVNALRLEDTAEGAVDKKVNAMDTLLDYIEDLNFASDFQKMGGLELLLYALDSAHDDVVWRAGECLATSVQNEEKLQLYVLEMGAMDKALQLLADSPNEKVVLKMIRTLSCLSTANARVIQAFLARAGLQKIKAAVDKHHANTKVLIKTAFFLAALPEAYPAFARHAAEAGLVGTFVNEVKKSSDGTLWECVLRLLANLCGAHGSCVLELQKEELNVDGLLGNRCGSIEQLDAEDRPAHAEELSYIAQLRAFLASEVDLRAEEDTGAVGGADGSMQLMTVEGSGAAAIPGSGPTDNSQKVDFEATTDWQPVHDNHILPAGLDIKVNLTTGAKFARQGSAPNLATRSKSGGK